MNREHPPIRPIRDKERLSITRRKAAVRSEFDSGRRGQTNIERGGKRFGKIVGKFRRPTAPAKISAGDDMIHTMRPIPWRADIPFHIRIEGEHLSASVEGDVERITETTSEEFEASAVAVGAQNVAGGKAHIAIEHRIVKRAGD